MIGRIVELAGEGRYLHMDRGFLVAERHGAELSVTDQEMRFSRNKAGAGHE